MVSRTILVLAGETVSFDFGNQTLIARFRLEKSNSAEKADLVVQLAFWQKDGDRDVLNPGLEGLEGEKIQITV